MNDSALVRGIEDSLTADGKPLLDVRMSHGDKVTAIRRLRDRCPAPKAARSRLWRTKRNASTACAVPPEVTHTRQGMRMLERFVRDICQCEALDPG